MGKHHLQDKFIFNEPNPADAAEQHFRDMESKYPQPDDYINPDPVKNIDRRCGKLCFICTCEGVIFK